MSEINTLKTQINKLNQTIKETEKKKNKLCQKEEKYRLFALRSTIICAITHAIGYLTHPLIILASMFFLWLSVTICGISILRYQRKEDKCDKELENYYNDIQKFKTKLEELSIQKQEHITYSPTPTIIIKSNNNQKSNNNIKKTR